MASKFDMTEAAIKALQKSLKKIGEDAIAVSSQHIVASTPVIDTSFWQKMKMKVKPTYLVTTTAGKASVQDTYPGDLIVESPLVPEGSFITIDYGVLDKTTYWSSDNTGKYTEMNPIDKNAT